jgi:hypothetical protein
MAMNKKSIEGNRVGLITTLEYTNPELIRRLRRVLWYFTSKGIASRRRLRALRDLHRGERCFIIGNGPSLKKMDLRSLADEYSFSLNRGYLYYDRIGKPCKYHVAVNKYVLMQWSEEVAALPNIKFLTWGARRWFPDHPSIIYPAGPVRLGPPRFSIDPTKDLWSGATVTYIAMQLAYYFGFKQVILIGVDHRFKTQGTPHELVISNGDDVDHFDPDYFGKGTQWQLPDLETSELAYALARHYYHRDGRKILDATVDGALQIFPKVSYASLFAS